MGNTWEIRVWKFVDWRDAYAYDEYWSGERWIAALWNFIKAKREGHGCVALHWR